jgi:hypothetical protein
MMRLSAAATILAVTTLHSIALGQSGSVTSLASLDQVRLEVSRLEELVREGAVARARLEQAKASLADAEDDAILRRTVFGQLGIEDLTQDQIAEMLEAARRRLARFQPKVDAARKLADDGVIPRTELTPLLEELDIRRRTLDLAESRARTVESLLALIRAEQEAEAKAAEDAALAREWRLFEKFAGDSHFQLTMLAAIAQAFEKRFSRTLPISALGMTEVHRSMGFDHRDRVDVAVTPDSPEGIWLRRHLEDARIPYFAFRSFVAGSSTGPHIHIGPPSLRLRSVAD